MILSGNFLNETSKKKSGNLSSTRHSKQWWRPNQKEGHCIRNPHPNSSENLGHRRKRNQLFLPPPSQQKNTDCFRLVLWNKSWMKGLSIRAHSILWKTCLSMDAKSNLIGSSADYNNGDNLTNALNKKTSRFPSHQILHCVCTTDIEPVKCPPFSDRSLLDGSISGGVDRCWCLVLPSCLCPQFTSYSNGFGSKWCASEIDGVNGRYDALAAFFSCIVFFGKLLAVPQGTSPPPFPLQRFLPGNHKGKGRIQSPLLQQPPWYSMRPSRPCVNLRGVNRGNWWYPHLSMHPNVVTRGGPPENLNGALEPESAWTAEFRVS